MTIAQHDITREVRIDPPTESIRSFITGALLSTGEHLRTYEFMCKCAHVLSATVAPDDKAGRHCEHCSRAYDVWYNGVIRPMPLPANATVDPKKGFHSRRATIKVDK